MKRFATFVLVLLLIVTAGCGVSQPSRFYRLSPASFKDIQAASQPSSNKIISIGPITVPVIINRPQIATLSDGNSVIISEYDRWAGSLNNELVRILVEDLSSLMPYRTIVPFELGRRLDSAYQIVIDIQQFDGVLGKNVTLKAGWIIMENDTKKIIMVRKSSISTDVRGNSYNDFVAGMSSAVGQLSLEISETFSRL